MLSICQDLMGGYTSLSVVTACFQSRRASRRKRKQQFCFLCENLMKASTLNAELCDCLWRVCAREGFLY